MQELSLESDIKVFDDKKMVFALAEIIGIDATIELLKRNARARYGSLTSSNVKSIYDKQYTEMLDNLPAAETVSGFRIHHYCHFILDYLRKCEKRQSVTIMDFGCGAGELDLALGSMGFCVHGVDFDADAIDKARAKMAHCRIAPGAVDFFLVDAIEPFRDRYDYVLFSDVVEHLGEGEFKDLLDVCSNLLKDDGKLLIHTPNGNIDRAASKGAYRVLVVIRESLRSCWRKLTGFRSTEADLIHQYYTQTHVNIMSPGRIKNLLKAKGFGRIEIVYRFDRPVLPSSLLACLGLSTDIGIVAHKLTVTLPSGSDAPGGLDE
jgi:2-polyprenyl-3-methyl-5-hydroxy-6-metoxy-1,4-benzoquinol methylase